MKNGKKVGKWTSYADEGIGYSWEQTIFEVFSTTYKTDTTVYRTFNSSITYVKDSMLVYGYVYTKDEHQYWINFECKNKKDCIYWYESKGNIIETSNYDELDLILGRFEYGEYNRKIRLLEKK